MRRKHEFFRIFLNLLTIFSLNFEGINSCLLMGNVAGNCVPSSDITKFVDICGNYLADYVCVPFNNVKALIIIGL